MGSMDLSSSLTIHKPHGPVELLGRSKVSTIMLHYNSVLILILGHSVAQTRMVFRPMYCETDSALLAPYLVYAQRFSLHSSSPEESTGMFRLHRHLRSGTQPPNQRRMGDVVPIESVRVAVDVTVRHGKSAQNYLTCQNSMELSDDFLFNIYSSRDLFYLMYSQIEPADC